MRGNRVAKKGRNLKRSQKQQKYFEGVMKGAGGRRSRGRKIRKLKPAVREEARAGDNRTPLAQTGRGRVRCGTVTAMPLNVVREMSDLKPVGKVDHADV